VLVPGKEKRDARQDEREDEEPEGERGSGEVEDNLGAKHGEQGQGVDQGVLLKAKWRSKFAAKTEFRAKAERCDGGMRGLRVKDAGGQQWCAGSRMTFVQLALSLQN
jgi:hypothetical protein